MQKELKNNRFNTILACLAAVVAMFGLVFVVKSVISVSNNASGRKLPIYCVKTEEPKIAISFDAAWGNEDTARILEILEENDVKATFFMTGGWVKAYPDDVKKILAAGHDLGNHSENHKNMSELTVEQCCDEIQSVHKKVQELTGYDMFLFRPPFGDYNDTVIETAEALGYHGIQWDVDSLDWKDYGVDSIIKTVVGHKHLGNGSIILCHNGAKYTADALDMLIKTLKERGYQFVPISELIYSEHYYMDVEGRQIPTK